MKNIHYYIRALALLLLASSLSSAGTGASLVGKWRGPEGDITEFLSDGTFVGATRAATATGKWTILADGRLKIEHQYGGGVFEFTVSGDTLILTNIQGQGQRLTKVGQPAAPAPVAAAPPVNTITKDQLVGTYQDIKDHTFGLTADGTYILDPDANPKPIGHWRVEGTNVMIKLDNGNGPEFAMQILSKDELSYERKGDVVRCQRIRK